LRRFDDAQRILGAALKNDPLSLDVLREIGEVHFYAGRYREAAETFQRIRAVDPDFPFVQFWLGRSLGFAGEPDQAIRLLEPLTGQHLGRLKASGARHTPWLAQVYVMKGRRADAEALAEEHKNGPTSAAVYAALGDEDRAFAALDRMADTQPHHIARLLLNPEMAALRGDPRLREVRQRLGLPPQ
jgi:predicted Zn-dependent protease